MQEDNPVAMTKANVEKFFSRILTGEQPARGGSSIKEQAKRAMGDFANFFIVSTAYRNDVTEPKALYSNYQLKSC